MFRFTYSRAPTLEEARAQFDAADDGLYLAGGHTLLPTMKNYLRSCDRLIDLRGIAHLHGISADDGAILIGATTTHAAVAQAPEVIAAIPALAGLAGSIGDRQVRNMGTIGGSLANNDPAADYPSAVLALNAMVQTDRRTISADDFFRGQFETALDDGEIITGVRFPLPAFAAYAKLRSAASRYAVVGVFVAGLADGQVRVAVTGAGQNGVFRARDLERALSDRMSPEMVAGIAIEPDELLSDASATADFRAHLVTTLCARALGTPGQAVVIS